MGKVIICDIDGVLIDTSWIWQTVKHFNMSENEGLNFFNCAADCDFSKIDKYFLNYIKFKLTSGYKLLFLTARSEVMTVSTINFIQAKTGLKYGSDFVISFRAKNDALPTWASKEKRLNEIITAGGTDIVLCIDDEQENINMYKAHNLPVMKWQNGMLPASVVEEYGSLINGLLGKEDTPCSN